MNILKKHAALAATLAIVAVATPAQARVNGWTAAGLGFAAGTVVGAAAVNANTRYYGLGYYYAPAYAYAPAASAYMYAPAYTSAYVGAPEYAVGYPYGGYAYAAAPVEADVYRPGFNGSVGIDVYDNGRYVGSDPDPAVRSELLREERNSH